MYKQLYRENLRDQALISFFLEMHNSAIYNIAINGSCFLNVSVFFIPQLSQAGKEEEPYERAE